MSVFWVHDSCFATPLFPKGEGPGPWARAYGWPRRRRPNAPSASCAWRAPGSWAGSCSEAAQPTQGGGVVTRESWYEM